MIHLFIDSLWLYVAAGACLVVAMVLLMGAGIAGVRMCDRCNRMVRRKQAVFCSRCGGVLVWPRVKTAR